MIQFENNKQMKRSYTRRDKLWKEKNTTLCNLHENLHLCECERLFNFISVLLTAIYERKMDLFVWFNYAVYCVRS